MENHFTPATVVNDEKIEIRQSLMKPYWQPRNFENKFFGQNFVREALELSHNVTTVHIARALGMKKIMDVATRFNLSNNTHSNYAMVLGDSESTLLEIVNAYAILANRGIKVEPQFIDSIWDNKGNPIFQLSNIEQEKQYVTSEAAAYQVISMLEGAVKRRTSKRVRPLGITLAAKTGTSNNSKDAWFIGATPDIAVGVYVGFDQPRPLGGKYATGARIALPIFYEFVKSLNLEDKSFPIPKTVHFVQMKGESSVRWEVFHSHMPH